MSVFVVSTDGNNFSSRHCTPSRCQPLVDALESCNGRAKRRESKCYLFARGSDIVWEGDVKFPHLATNEHMFSLKVAKSDRPGTISEGGRTIVRKDQSPIPLDLRFDGKICGGSADRKKMIWKITRSNAVSYEGTFTRGEKTLYQGTGKSSSGLSAEIAIYLRK